MSSWRYTDGESLDREAAGSRQYLLLGILE